MSDTDFSKYKPKLKARRKTIAKRPEEKQIILPKIPSPFEGRFLFEPRRRSESNVSSSILKTIISITLVFYLLWYRHEKIKLGYCLEEQHVKENSFLEFLQPHCEPCPLNAICKNRKFIGCQKGFLIKKHPLDTMVYPISPKCVPDMSLVNKVHNLFLKSLEELKMHYGKVLCSTFNNGKGYLSEHQLYNILYKAEKENMSEYEFKKLFTKVYSLLLKDQDLKHEFQTIKNGEHIAYFKAKTPKFTFYCQFKMVYVNFIKTHFKQVIFVLVVLGVVAYFRYINLEHQKDTKLVNQLYQQVIQLLIERDHLSVTKPSEVPDNSISINLLRDQLLSDKIPNIKRRERIWNKLTLLINNNSNIRTFQRDHRGEAHKVWEWVGDYNFKFNIREPIIKSNSFTEGNIEGDEDEGAVDS